MLAKGNSDPFDAFPVPFSPDVTGLVTLQRDRVGPALYGGWINSAAAQADWLKLVADFHDVCTARGAVAMMAAVRARVQPSAQQNRQALMHRTRAMTVFRSRLTTTNTLDHVTNAPPFRELQLLISASVHAHSLAEAQVHIRMMQSLVISQSKYQGPIDLASLTLAAYHDSQIAAIYLSPPALDMDHFFPSIFGKFDPMARSMFPPGLEDEVATSPIDPCVGTTGILHEMILARRLTMRVWQLPNRENLATPVMTLWMITRNCVVQSQLIKHYHAMKAQMEMCIGGEEYEDCCAQAYMALALLYVARSSSSEPAVLGVELFGAAPRILSAMKEIMMNSVQWRTQLQQRQQQQQTDMEDKYANARLWTLFAGAHGEQVRARLKQSASLPPRPPSYTTNNAPMTIPADPPSTGPPPSSTSSIPDPSHGWFNRQLALASRSRGINSWAALREILQGFVYSDNIPPNGTDWFYRTMSGALDA